eukprot:gene7798-13654_t
MTGFRGVRAVVQRHDSFQTGIVDFDADEKKTAEKKRQIPDIRHLSVRNANSDENKTRQIRMRTFGCDLHTFGCELQTMSSHLKSERSGNGPSECQHCSER